MNPGDSQNRSPQRPQIRIGVGELDPKTSNTQGQRLPDRALPPTNRSTPPPTSKDTRASNKIKKRSRVSGTSRGVPIATTDRGAMVGAGRQQRLRHLSVGVLLSCQVKGRVVVLVLRADGMAAARKVRKRGGVAGHKSVQEDGMRGVWEVGRWWAEVPE